MTQWSRIPGHIIRIVFYANWNGDLGLIKVLWSLYILKLVRPPN
jgi:hypothetical protein